MPSCCPMSWSGQMCGCDSAATARASRSKPLAGGGVVGQVRRQHLEGDGAVQARISRTVDLPHAARAGGADDLVGAEPGAGLRAMRCARIIRGWCGPTAGRAAAVETGLTDESLSGRVLNTSRQRGRTSRPSPHLFDPQRPARAHKSRRRPRASRD